MSGAFSNAFSMGRQKSSSSSSSNPYFGPRAEAAYQGAMGNADLLSKGFDPTGEIYKGASRNLLESVRPTFAGRGLISSGPGLEGELAGLSGLNTQFAQLRQQGLNQAIQAYLEAMKSSLGQRTSGVGAQQYWNNASSGAIGTK